jgi:hypothetical protein
MKTQNGTITDGTGGMLGQLQSELAERSESFQAKTTFYDASRRPPTAEEREKRDAELVARETQRLLDGLYDEQRQKEMELPEFAIDNFLPLGVVGTLAGQPSSGKSTFLTHLARCLNYKLPLGRDRGTDGEEVYYGEPNLAGSVLYVSPEDPNSIIARIQAWDNHHDPEGEVRRTRPDHQTFVLRACPNLDNETSYKALLEVVDKTQPILVIFDTLAATLSEMGGNSATPEHDNTLLTRLYQTAQRLATERRLAVLTAHHPAKGKDGDLLRGGGAIRASSRVVWEIKEDGELRRVLVEKANDFDRSLSSFTLKIEGQRIGTNRHGKEIRMPVMTGGRITPIASGQIKTALACLHQTGEEGGVASRKAFCSEMEARGIRVGNHGNTIKRLKERQLIECLEPNKKGYWQAFKLTPAGKAQLGLAEQIEQGELAEMGK